MLVAVWHALSGHFSFQERFFLSPSYHHNQAAENVAMAVLVASRWHCGLLLMCNHAANVDWPMPSRLSSWL
jgi:hypothetical protein